METVQLRRKWYVNTGKHKDIVLAVDEQKAVITSFAKMLNLDNPPEIGAVVHVSEAGWSLRGDSTIFATECIVSGLLTYEQRERFFQIYEMNT